MVPFLTDFRVKNELVNACFWVPFGNQNRCLVTVSPSNAFLLIFSSLLAPLWAPLGALLAWFGALLATLSIVLSPWGRFGSTSGAFFCHFAPFGLYLGAFWITSLVFGAAICQILQN